MRVFNWPAFLAENNVPYSEKGANVGRGEINIKCPFCGSADPSMHMGLSLDTGYWSCWRNRSAHSGKSPLRLIVQLLGVPYWKARQLAGLDRKYIDPEGFDALAAQIMRKEGYTRIEEVKRRHLLLPASFSLIDNWGRSRNHFNYLKHVRGFGGYTTSVIDTYLLLFEASGDMHDRIIFPYQQDGELVTWTGRDIGRSPIRYRDLEVDASVLPPKETLYNHDAVISGGKRLCVVEGPMDVCKLDFAGQRYGVRAVGLSTNSMSEEQIYLLEEASSNFEKVVFLMDNKASGLSVVDSMRLRQQVRTIKNAMIQTVPKQFKDCGEMSVPEAKQFAAQLLEV